jgi:carboxypeptidase family protein
MKVRSILFTTIVLFFSFSLLAQESTVKGGLAGTVVDSSGAVVANAKVTLVGPIGTTTATSNGQGYFDFERLTPGTYSVRTEASGFKSTEIKAVEVNVNRTSNIRVTLTPGGASEVVEVSAAAAGVDEASTKIETSLNDTFYNQIPVQRNVTGLFYAAAGVNDGGGTGRANPSIGGGSGLENQYIADGVNITDGDFGGIGVYSRSYGPLSTGINLSFVKEVDVKTGGFEPQYGKSTGGIVQIVTKSGSEQYHGGVSAYFGGRQLEVEHPNPDLVRSLNQQGNANHQGEWDIAGELGGYIPGAQKHIFFFGSFNPTWNRLYNVIGNQHGLCGGPNALCGVSAFGGPFSSYPNVKEVTIPSISYDYSAKGTFKLNDNHVIETSLFGDPSHQTQSSPNGTEVVGLMNEFNNTAFSKLSNGSRNWVARYNATLSPTWLFDASFSWGHNYLNETPQDPNVFGVFDTTGSGCQVPLSAQIANPNAACPTQAPNLGWDGTQLTGIYERQGLGYYENTKGDNRRLNFDTQKVFNMLGQHTISIGYSTEWNRYYGTRQATGGGYQVPIGLATSSGLCPADPNCTATASNVTDYANTFELDPAANWGFTPGSIGVYENTPANGLVETTLVQNRGFFSTPQFDAHGRVQAAYAGDSWAIGRHIVFNAGYRWDQEEMQGIAYKDPITQLNKQVHYTFTDNWSPRFGLSIDPKGDRKTKIYGNFGRTNYNLPLDMGIRSLGNEEDAEFVLLVPPYTNPNPGTPCSQSNPCMLATNPDGTITPAIDDAHALTPYLYLSTQPGEGIAHGTKMMNLEEEVAGIEHEFPHGILVSLRYQQRHLRRIVEDTSAVPPEAALIGVVQQFQITNPSPTLDIFHNTLETILPAGTANSTNCPSGLFGTNTNPFTQAQADVCINNPATAGFPGADGIPDGFAQPVRVYKAVEFEVTKAFSHGWQTRTNYRWSTLAGNYEGAFRNDNGQSDPGISSLFDFTPGKLGLLGNQFGIGFLNTDRRHIFNNFISYTFQNGFMKNFTLGTGVRIETGVPINDLRAHPVYQNAGEVPFGGRGALGRTPTAGYGDVHADYSHKVGERSTLHFGADLFNVANQKTLLRIDNFQDASLNVPNADFLKPVGNGNVGISPAYQRPFNARLFAKWEF